MNPFRIITLLCFLALVFAYILEYGFGQLPCDLCLLQRFAIVGLGITCLIASIHAPKGWGHKLYAGLALIWSLGGLTASARQVYLQSLPEELKPGCGPGLLFKMNHGPWIDAITQSMQGSGDCAKIGWTFMGMSLAFWTGVLFLGFVCLSIWAAQIKKVVRL
jgi:protein dithiol:quinone oxidoreductase